VGRVNDDWSRRKLLEELSRNTRQPVLAEMAREMLAGRLTPRQAMSSDAYMTALGGVAQQTITKYRDMSPEERAAEEREGRLAVERLMAEEERPARVPVEEFDEEPTGSIMVRGSHRPSENAADPAPDVILPRSVRDRRRR
jgi:DNA-binding transcriptional MocR family regulator